MLNKEAILIGYSGHGAVVAEAAELARIKIYGYTETGKVTSNPFNLEYLGFEKDPQFKGWATDKSYILGIGDNHLREKAGNLIISKERELLNVIHPCASVTKELSLGTGNFIARNAAVNPRVSIGDFCIINTGAIVEHDCAVDDAVHIAPGAVLTGNVRVGHCTFIGANAVIKQGVKIGKNVIIGAGSVVIKDVGDNQKVIGNPGRLI
ncbi:sugar O-acyltransferase, sialic acid O-acetyltransferase NeuD family [Salegentibacter echinorum]|uniref:Sugar O-acyltransferase, sialic acid O-acetyltransferase NeuD family n=1 Tax=Salegentibacter echinorum TaxID=1073325 RepID=A0A1M5FHH7_SALEC|nr:acetyltransferase [Salegentibacter echinorum]SHF90936.1 sugar O-acyltransferase, sialic acid O-acetyltransferase NeuD family [Salegentibacter echinorum]